MTAFGWYIPTQGQKTQRAHDLRRKGNLCAEIEVLEIRRKLLVGVMDAIPEPKSMSDAWHEAAQEYDDLGDAIGKMQSEVDELPNEEPAQ